ncbi:MAG TPA: cytochrome c-type biogenesis protein CcmH [Actinomycetota bacterium]|nr:cytochrome c-type biogenesis protein CcmH [Actinomycetota bacterium]
MSREPAAGTRRRAGVLAAIAAIVVIAALVGIFAARGPDPNAVPTAQQVYDRTMSPFCTGLTLAACPSNQAIELRATIAAKVTAGETNRQINRWLLATYPKTVLGSPSSPVAWLIPALVVLAGLAVVIVVVARGGGKPGGLTPEQAEAALPPITPGDHARLTEDLRRFAEGTSE